MMLCGMGKYGRVMTQYIGIVYDVIFLVLVYEGVLEVRLGTAQTSCLVHQGEVLHYHADQCHTYHNPGSTPTRAAMVIQYTAQ